MSRVAYRQAYGLGAGSRVFQNEPTRLYPGRVMQRVLGFKISEIAAYHHFTSRGPAKTSMPLIKVLKIDSRPRMR